jgi:Xaa-Pro aminopeptidase
MAQDSFPRITLRERDRRYAAIREQLRERGVDGVIVAGTNLFYLTNGLPGERSGFLPARDEPIMVALNGRHLADIPAQVLADAQDWVKDLRPGNDASPMIARIQELRLEAGTIGVADGSLGHNFYAQLASELPHAKIVDVSDILLNLRTIKSEEEIAMIDMANRVFDAGVDGVYEAARPGMLGKEAIQEGIRAMWKAGGDLDSSMGMNFGAVPKQNPILGHLCMDRPIQAGDIATLTAHAEYLHYAGHSDQEISFGEPRPLHREMFAAVLHTREAVLKAVKPGATQRDLIDVYQRACAETGFKSSPHSQIHQYGIDVPEFPGPAFTVPGGRNFVLRPGMIYSISPTIVGKDGNDTVLGGTSLVVTETGHRELGNRKVEMLIVR